MLTAREREAWDRIFEDHLRQHVAMESAHDMAHLRRVRANALKLTAAENAEVAVVLPAVWLHDCVALPKSAPNASASSVLAAKEAVRILELVKYPTAFHEPIFHAIEAHSFSAQIVPLTLEAKVVQDADRLDALGAIGVARCFSVGGSLARAIYSLDDPLARVRTLDDKKYSLDHFFVKLLEIEQRMQTATGRKEAAVRTVFLRDFLNRLEVEIGDATTS